jgi:hypothetical protein
MVGGSTLSARKKCGDEDDREIYVKEVREKGF